MDDYRSFCDLKQVSYDYQVIKCIHFIFAHYVMFWKFDFGFL